MSSNRLGDREALNRVVLRSIHRQGDGRRQLPWVEHTIEDELSIISLSLTDHVAQDLRHAISAHLYMNYESDNDFQDTRTANVDKTR